MRVDSVSIDACIKEMRGDNFESEWGFLFEKLNYIRGKCFMHLAKFSEFGSKSDNINLSRWN